MLVIEPDELDAGPDTGVRPGVPHGGQAHTLLPAGRVQLNRWFPGFTAQAADAGATIFPLIPAFYYRPANLDAMAREFAYRVLAHIGLPQPDAFLWKG